MTKKKKILMLVENISVPLDPRVWVEAKALRDAGYEISVICPKGDGRDEESYIYLENIFIYRYRLPIVGNKYQAYVAEYTFSLLCTFFLSLKVLFKHNFDVVHAANPPDTFFLIGMFYRLLGKKYIFDQHDLAPEMFLVKFKGRMKLLYKLQIFLEKCSYRTSHLIITTNATQKKRAIERIGCYPDKVRVVRNGPSLHQMELVPPEPELKRGRCFLLAYIGVMGRQDGVEYALYALENLVYRRGRQDVSLVLMGDGDAAPELRNLSSTLKLDEYVNFTGWLERKDVQRYLSVIDVGLTPDPQNGMNEYLTMIKTMEYMAVGKPVVAFDLHEARSLAQDASLYAIPNQVEDFANKIEILLADEELRSVMGAFGRKRIEEELGWEHSKKNLLLAYQALLSTNSEPTASISDTVLTRG
jgi:glycosyltransferase involved in cell wall biosynthesis